MIFKIAICDDDKNICEDLRKILNEIAELNEYEFDVSIFISGKEFYNFFIENDYNFDIIFLDIELSERINGVYIGNAISNKFYKDSKLVYYSSHEEYALDLFKTHPFDFIIKSSDSKTIYTEIQNVVISIIKLINKQHKPFIYYVKNNKYEIDLYKILYFCSHGRMVEIVTYKNNVAENIFYGKISEIGRQLEKSDFFFIHRSFLVNYHNVSKFEYEKLTLSSGKELYITQAYRKKVYAMRMNRIGGEK